MNIKITPLSIFIVATGCLYSQRIGVSYSTHVFPFYGNNNENNDFEDARNAKANFRVESLFNFNYHFKNNTLSLGASLGLSTQSRILSNDKLFNFFLSPGVSYTFHI